MAGGWVCPAGGCVVAGAGVCVGAGAVVVGACPLGVVVVVPGWVVVSCGCVSVLVVWSVVVVFFSSVFVFVVEDDVERRPPKIVVWCEPLTTERPATNSGSVMAATAMTQASRPVAMASFQCRPVARSRR